MANDYPIRFTAQLRQHLRALRNKRGLTQAQLGALVGVSQARIAEIEANPGLVSFEQLMQVLSTLGVAISLRESPSALDPVEQMRQDAKALDTPERIRQAVKALDTKEQTRQAVKALDTTEQMHQAAKDLDTIEQMRMEIKRMEESTSRRNFVAHPKKGSW